MMLTIRCSDMGYELFKALIEDLLCRVKDPIITATPTTSILRCVEELSDDNDSEDHMFKLVGLIIADGPLSRLMKLGQLRRIAFRGLTLDTLYAVFHSGIRLSHDVRIGISKQNTLRMGRPYFDIILGLSEKVRSEILYIVRSMVTDQAYFHTLPESSKAPLLAGLVDGDGYIGSSKRHLIISYDRESHKGSLVDRFLSSLASQGFVSLGKYRGRPHYERYVRLTNLGFARSVYRYIYHPKKSREFKLLLKGISRNYECRYSVKGIEALLKRATSVYIDFRRSEKGRKVPVLVVYVKGNHKRVSVKITAKCMSELHACVNNPSTRFTINRKYLEVVLRYLELLKAYKPT